MNIAVETRPLSQMSSDIAFQLLKKGNQRFVNNVRINRNYLQEIEATKEGQEPFAVVISCMDSRTSPELVFDQGFGDIFSIRIAGNVVTPEVIGSAEYACKAVGSKLILVLGHVGCGAVKGAIENVEFGHLPSITHKIRACLSPRTNIEEVTIKNVRRGIESLMEESSIIRNLVMNNEVKIVGGIYDITTGKVEFLND